MLLFLDKNMEIFSSLRNKLILKNEIILDIKVISNSSCLKLEKLNDSFYKLKIIKVAEKGKANQEIINYLKSNFKPLKVKIKIINGNLKSYKKISIKLVK